LRELRAMARGWSIGARHSKRPLILTLLVGVW
jgi:hypothetical protein